jgi:hypothetical protein
MLTVCIDVSGIELETGQRQVSGHSEAKSNVCEEAAEMLQRQPCSA